MSSLKKKNFIILSLLIFSLAIIFGAFGAHYIKNNFSLKMYETFKTGSQYHLIFSLFLIMISSLYKEMNINISFWVGVIGIILFSGNCYLYAFTGIKVFAMIVPLGGLCFIISPILLAIKLKKVN